MSTRRDFSVLGNFIDLGLLAVTASGKGYGIHWMGGAAWGGHTCPDNSPGWQSPRSLQRAEIIRRAKILRRSGQYPAPHGPVPVIWVAAGITSLLLASATYKLPVSTILRLTVDAYGAFSAPVSLYLQAGDLSLPVPQGAQLVVGSAS